MKNNLLNEINDIKYLLNYNRGLVLSEQQNNYSNPMTMSGFIDKTFSNKITPEQRAQDSYKYMIDAISGGKLNTKKVKSGIDILQTKDEFYRMNTLFQNGRTQYSSFDEMVRGAFKNLGPQTIGMEIDTKLKKLSVPFEYPNNRWENFKLVNPKIISSPLSNTASASSNDPNASNASNASNAANTASPAKTTKKRGYIDCKGTYKYGCKADAIGTVQACLGLDPDKKFGKNTRNALKAKGYTTFTDKDINKICGYPTSTITNTKTNTSPEDSDETVVDANPSNL